MPESGSGLLAAFLQCRADPRDAAAWEKLLCCFGEDLQRITGRLARQYGASAVQDRVDLVQEVCLKISRSARMVPASALASNETISAYLKALTANTTRDVLRSRFSRKRGNGVTVPLDDRLASLANELDWHNAERTALLRQVDELLEGSARDRAVFWLYYRQGLTGKEISLIPSLGLTLKGVESLIHRLTASVRSRVARGQASRAASSTGMD